MGNRRRLSDQGGALDSGLSNVMEPVGRPSELPLEPD